MRQSTLGTLARAGARILHDGDQHLVLLVRSTEAEAFGGKLELEALYRFFNAAAAARAQALHLTSNMGAFILREYVDQQLFAECHSMSEVEEAIERRKADQSERVVRLRKLAAGHAQEGEHRGGWVDYAARVRQQERGRHSSSFPHCATGVALDAVGALHRVERNPGEADDVYRQRILQGFAVPPDLPWITRCN